MQKLFSEDLYSELLEDTTREAKNKVLNKLDPVLQQKVMEKAKLTIDEQVNYLKAKGIQFNIVDEQKAKSYLMENSYYYKVTAYRLNFKKDSNGLYHNLEFAYLQDIATIDMHLRYLVLKLSLDIEHTLKSTLMKIITDDPGEDGYRIIEDFNNYLREKFISRNRRNSREYQHVKDRIIKEVKDVRDYNYDFYMKTREKISVWKLIEMMSYGDLINFINFYVSAKRHKSRQFKKAVKFLGYSKNLRDSSAHSRPILLNVTEINQLKGTTTTHKTHQSQAEPDLKLFARKNGLDKKVVSRLLTNFRIHDLCALILLHDEYVQSKLMRKARKKEMLKLFKRAQYRKAMYNNNVTEFDDILELFFGVIKKYKNG